MAAKLFLVIACCVASFAAHTFGELWNTPAYKDGCGCCWPIPDSCCPCTCKADVAIMIDRSGSSKELNQVKSLVADLLDYLGEQQKCFATSLVSFAVKPKVLYEFGSDASQDSVAAKDLVATVRKPKGNTYTDRALAEVEGIFNGANNDAERCDVTLLFTDGGSEDKDLTIDALKSLRDNTNAWVCLVGMMDPNATPKMTENRNLEFDNIIANSRSPNSEMVAKVDFSQDILPCDLLDRIKSCLCKSC